MEKLNVSSSSACSENDNIPAVTSSRGLSYTSYNVTNSNNYSSCVDQMPDLRDTGLNGLVMVRYLDKGDINI